MAKTKTTQHKNNAEAFVVADKKILPIVGMFGRSPEISYPKEFEVIDSLKVNQSASFPTNKTPVIQAIRGRLFKTENKKFVVKKVDAKGNSRIWRVPDNAVIRAGGRQKGGPAKLNNKDVNNS